MIFVLLFLGAAGFAFWCGKNKCVAKDTGRRAFYAVGIATVICAIATLIEIIKTGSF